MNAESTCGSATPVASDSRLYSASCFEAHLSNFFFAPAWPPSSFTTPHQKHSASRQKAAADMPLTQCITHDIASSQK
jgi:hypothetical protein